MGPVLSGSEPAARWQRAEPNEGGGSGQAGVRGSGKDGVPGDFPELEASELLPEEQA